MGWLVSVGLEDRFEASSGTGCPNRRLRTKASIAQLTGESTGVVGRSVAKGPKPTDANTPCTRPRMVNGAVGSGSAAQMVCPATRSICGGEIVATACFSAGLPVAGALLASGTAPAGALTTLCALARIEAAGCDASRLLLGGFPTATGELVFDDDDDDAGFGADGGTLVSVAIGPAAGCAPLVAEATAVRPAAEVIARDCAPPLPCAIPLRGSSVAVDPLEVMAVMLVALVVDEVEVDPATEVALDGAASDSAAPVDEEVEPVGAVVTLDDVLPVEGVAPVGDVEVESVDDEPESVGSAPATPGVVATATPTPNATANAPTRPICAP